MTRPIPDAPHPPPPGFIWTWRPDVGHKLERLIKSKPNISAIRKKDNDDDNADN